MSDNRVYPGSREASARYPRVVRLQARLAGLRERIRWHPVLDTVWRTGIFVTGWLLVLAGVLMLVLPGPGWGTIFLGFALLATEFIWARRALRKAKNLSQQAARRAFAPKIRRRAQIVTAVVLAVVILGGALYVWNYGLPMPASFFG